MCVIHLRKLTNIDYSKIYFLKKIQSGAFCVDGEDTIFPCTEEKPIQVGVVEILF